MIASEVASLLLRTSHGAWIYSITGVDIEHVDSICSKITTFNDMGKCYIDGMKSIKYVTEWPYAIG